jgi:iron complex outermembrane receptor protein
LNVLRGAARRRFVIACVVIPCAFVFITGLRGRWPHREYPMTIHLPRTALAVALTIAFQPAIAAVEDEAAIVVTASRFLASDRTVPAHVTTLTRTDIAATPAASLPDLLATRAGIDVRSLYGNQAADASVALRGFGENASLRTLVLVDGRRLDQLEFTAPNWASIPLDSIEKIEIVRGSGSVLHGDQAVAGVINIVTRRGRENSTDVALTLGSFDTKELAASLSRNDTPLRYALSLRHTESDEYRRNNAHRNTAGSARVARDFAQGEAYVELGASELHFGLPGAVTAAQYRDDPRAAETTDSWFERDNLYLRPGVRWQLAAGLEFAAELGVEQSRNRAWISNWFSYRDVAVDQLSFTPRLKWAHGMGGLPSTTVFGFDWTDAHLDQDQAAAPGGAVTKRVALDRTGRGLYVYNTTELADNFALTLGARQQRIHTHATDSTAVSVTDDTANKTATELGAVWRPATTWKLFAKASRTFRYPVLDELTTMTGFAAPAPRPETGHGMDVGAEWRAGGHSVQATLYDLKIEDEIAWNGAPFPLGQNENLQKTRHRGLEIDSRWKLAADWRFDLSWTGKEATFRAGANSGKTIPLVPETRWTAKLSWAGGGWGHHALLVNHVGKRYFGGDEANVLVPLPAYTTLDWQSRWQLQQWELGLRIANLTDKKYSPVAFDYGFGASYYPANPRGAYLTARYRF